VPSVDHQTVLIVGLGLIGGSIARALADKSSYRVLACGRDDRPLRQAQADGVIDQWSHDMTELAPQADIVVVATPTRSVARIFSILAGCVSRNTIITDAASVKGSVVADAQCYFAASMDRVVPAHPIAGSEQTGYAASRGDLYTGRNVIITPDRNTNVSALRRVVMLWQHQGAEVHLMSAQRHDEILAGTSHLPHLLAFDLVNTLIESVSEPDRPWQVFDFAAGGFADFSRIASSDATMWRDIFLSNSKATAELLDRYIERLQSTRDSMLAQDGETLHGAFTRAKTARDDFMASFNARRQKAKQGFHAGENENQQKDVDSQKPPAASVLCFQKSEQIKGECQLSASNRVVFEAISDAARQNQVTVLHGCPDNREIRDFIRCQIENGALIAGPDNGCITVYSGGSYAGDNAPVIDKYLPADGLMIALLAVLVGSGLAISKGCNQVCVRSGWRDDLAMTQPLRLLQSHGLIALQQQQDGDLLLTSALDKAEVHDLPLAISESLDDEGLLLAVLAVVFFNRVNEPLQIVLTQARGQELRYRLKPLQALGIELSELSPAGGDEDIVQFTLRRESDLPSNLLFDAHHDEWLALCVMALTASSVTSGNISQAGNIRQFYPGLIALLNDLGMVVSDQQQHPRSE
tara:strand:- start:1386 stop:3296 length:1911 start_codon:yes stop_codon:yes gene_type:complete